MVKINRRTLFDRLSLYRYVAIMILPLFIRSIYRALTETYPFTGWVFLFWLSCIMFFSAIFRDTWEVVKVRREIRKSINDVINGDDPVK